ncbi:MAG: branched-chain amino acid transport system ATP-binding protein, partial [Actinomycetota bacterium]|nr:branched-chain amino acid transport system ATP-binding protein [Actinomycetota bacterium]
MTAIEEAVEELESAPQLPPPGRGLKAITGGFAAAPLVVLFGLNMVDEFDRAAFGALIPEIRDRFGVSDSKILTLGAITAVFTLLASLPLGVLADRLNRVRLSIAAAVLWGVTSVLTGVVPSLFLLYLVRMGSGVGRIINEVVHPSLLADYYPRENQPRVFGVHRAANSIGNIGGPLAGIIAALIFWQAAFWILALPTVVFLVLAIVRLREPKRGESIDAALAAEAEADDESTPFAEARRQLFAVKTLRRLWLGAFFLGIGALQIGNILGIFFDRVYGVGPVGRGFVQLLFGAGNVVGLIIGARLAGRASDAGRLHRLAVITGLSFVQFAFGLVLLGAIRAELLAFFFAFLLSIGIGAYQPAYFALVGLVSPPKIRAQAYAWAILIYGCGGLTFILLIGAGDTDSATRLRWVVVILAAIVALAGSIGASAQRFVKRDAEQAANALATAAKLKAELAAGGADRTLLVCRGVDVAYDTVQILFGVDMEVKEGEIIALLGTNGAGKSTLLKAICGLVDPIGGAIFFDGRDITHADPVQAAKAGIVQVPGGKAVFPTLTVAEHFRAGTWLYANEDPADVQRRIDEVLDLFPRLRERWDQMAGNMSGGEQQQLALGMAFVAKPKLLIIDELSLGLAPTIVEQLLNIVRKIHASGCTIILVEQSVNVALTIAHRAYFMEKGEVRFSGPTEELLERG